MSLLISEHKAELDLVDKQLHETNLSLSTFNTLEGFAEKHKQITESLAKLSKQAITSKEKKLLRDRKAFAGHKAYLWPSTQPHKFPQRSSNVNTVNNHVDIVNSHS